MPTTENPTAALAAALSTVIYSAVSAALKESRLLTPPGDVRVPEVQPKAAAEKVKPEPKPKPEKPEAVATPATVAPVETTDDSKPATAAPTVPEVQALAGAASKVIGSVAVRDLIKEVTGAASIPAADVKTLPALAAALIAAAEGSA